MLRNSSRNGLLVVVSAILLATAGLWVLPGNNASAATTAGLPPMPVGDLPGWHQTMAQDFNTDAAIGQFGATYGANWNGYNFPQSRITQALYAPDKTISVKNGVMDIFAHTDPATGNRLTAAPLPSGYVGQTYGRYSVLMRADPTVLYKTSFLLWPVDNVWNEGELNWPETGLGKTPTAWLHCVGAHPELNCKSTTASPSVTDNDWHVYTTSWTPTTISWDMDGVQLQTAPNTLQFPMRWVLQVESYGPNTPATAQGHVQIGWATQYSYAPATIQPGTIYSAACNAAINEPTYNYARSSDSAATNYAFKPGQFCLQSENGLYRAIFQSDGNMVVYKGGLATWNSRTWGLGATELALQADGNVVIYKDGPPLKALWNSRTWAMPKTAGAARLVMQDDGNFVSYGANGKAYWSSKTGPLSS